MRFLDYNGSGGLDQRDIATSAAVEKTTHKETGDDARAPGPPEANAGCATTATFMALAIMTILLAP